MIEITLMAWMHLVMRWDAIAFNVTNQELANEQKIEKHSGKPIAQKSSEMKRQMSTKKDRKKTIRIAQAKDI